MRPILTAFGLMLPLAGVVAADPFRPGMPELPVRTGTGLPVDAAELADAGREIVEGLERFRDGLMLFLEEIPRFAPPEITEDGDIILRRVDPPGGGMPDEETAPLPQAGKRAVEI